MHLCPLFWCDSFGCLQGLPYLVKDLVKEEVELYNRNLRSKPHLKHIPEAVDPSPQMIYVFNQFLAWYNHIRQPKLNTVELTKVISETYELKLLLRKVFPNKSGQMYTLCVLMELYIMCV
jgi:hypothetical protein